MAIKKLYSSDSRRRTISKLNSNFVAITPDVILEISDKSPTENMESIIWIDTSMDITTKLFNTQTYANDYFASHPAIDRSTFKYIGDDGKPTLEFKKMIYGDDYDPDVKYILKSRYNTMVDFCKPIETQNGIKAYNLNDIIFNTESIDTLYNAFKDATHLESINTSSWNTSKVKNISYMFRGCSSLTSINVSKWDTSKVTNMYSAFNGCKKLQSIDISEWDTGNVNDMDSMFYGCNSLTSLDLSKWNTSKLLNTSSMFRNCNSLTSLDLSKWNTSKLKDMSYMFLGCNLLTYIDLSEWDTSKVTNMYSAFNGCSSLTTITGVIDLKNCTDYSSMFIGCNNLTSVKVKNLPTDIDTFCTRANINKSKVIVVQ